MSYIDLFVISVLGLTVGSFLSALTYRLPRGESVLRGRSVCPKCKAKIAWHDNIPLLSYLILSGRCRKCGKKISPRYPLIESSTAFLFLLTYIVRQNCIVLQGLAFERLAVCFWNELLGFWALPFLLLVGSILIAILVIDIEHQIIPDELVFILLGIVFFAHVLGNNNILIYRYLFSGFAASLSLLFLHFVTLGRGMGLGDVKLVIPMGMVLGWPGVLVWFYISFVGGGLVGLALILAGKAKFGREIAFGPFLIIAFFVTLFWGDLVANILIPFFG